MSGMKIFILVLCTYCELECVARLVLEGSCGSLYSIAPDSIAKNAQSFTASVTCRCFIISCAYLEMYCEGTDNLRLSELRLRRKKGNRTRAVKRSLQVRSHLFFAARDAFLIGLQSRHCDDTALWLDMKRGAISRVLDELADGKQYFICKSIILPGPAR